MLRSPLAPDILENRIRFYGHMNKKDYGDDVVIGLLKLTINQTGSIPAFPAGTGNVFVGKFPREMRCGKLREKLANFSPKLVQI